MNSLDRAVAKGVKSVLEEDLGKTTYRKIEKELYDVYGVSVLDAVGDFTKLDLVLRKFFGKHTSNIESKIFKKVLLVGQATRNESTITIKDPEVAKTIFEAYGDPAKKAILDLLLHESSSIPEAIAKSKLPKASTYNRIKELIGDGLLTMVGFTNATDGRKVSEYATTFSKTIFEIQDENITINANINSKFLKDSFAYNSIHSL